ncbi:MAG: DUF5397 family protein [Myxococcales bacterium]|nr:DUF5397 family protein [Myxococcales bacterium]
MCQSMIDSGREKLGRRTTADDSTGSIVAMPGGPRSIRSPTGTWLGGADHPPGDGLWWRCSAPFAFWATMGRMVTDAPFLPDPRNLVSTRRRFGPFGPAYRIDTILRVLDNGDTVFQVSVPHPVGDDEVVERRFSEVLADPEEGGCTRSRSTSWSRRHASIIRRAPPPRLSRRS